MMLLRRVHVLPSITEDMTHVYLYSIYELESLHKALLICMAKSFFLLVAVKAQSLIALQI